MYQEYEDTYFPRMCGIGKGLAYFFFFRQQRKREREGEEHYSFTDVHVFLRVNGVQVIRPSLTTFQCLINTT